MTFTRAFAAIAIALSAAACSGDSEEAPTGPPAPPPPAPPPPPPPAPTTGNLTITTATVGSSLDADGYTVAVDGGSALAIGINESKTYRGERGEPYRAARWPGRQLHPVGRAEQVG
jgi:hypothetical protein